MKTKILFITLALSTITSINAQWWGDSEKVRGNGTMATKTRTIENYDQLKVKGSLDVKLVAGKEDQVTLKGESNLLEYIVTKVEDDILKVYVKKGYYLKYSMGKKLVITVPFEDISKVSLSGSGDIYGSDPIKADNLSIALSGSGDISLQVATNNVSTQVSGSGDMLLKGDATNFKGRVSGSGDINAYNLKAKNVTASVAGSGEIEITAIETIKAKVSGSGDISYKGNPKIQDKSVSGSGDITSM